ncbi:hypothetical protein NON00_02275 [Roseomonas sp. GC11]|uniref:hypothetical protein n=1 Tax=Roseomonas sp. GC11 TaxID=2950546 RepID=UPI0021093C21|nr:hypothetical protein [Roseomonas sp. GC11]MCQ4158753.1 hypothetical protein [Roseomonas sp. GC11]
MIQTILDNFDSLWAVIAAAHTLALVIVNLTPTPKDDLWVGRAYRALEMVAGLVSRRAKQ